MKIQLDSAEPLPDAQSEEIARVILSRFGLLPRKKDGMAKMHSLLLQIYERKKQSNRDKKPELAVMTVEEMGVYAGIKRQTMYDYLSRWLSLNLLKKTSFVNEGKVVIGYELNGHNLEAAFKKAELIVRNHTDSTLAMVRTLQNQVKNEKIKESLTEAKPPETEQEEKEESATSSE